jgi:8-oxo-dGTP diphosphatase
LDLPVVVVLEGAARTGCQEGELDGVTVVHAPHSGDDTLLIVASVATSPVTLVSADRELRQRAKRAGADLAGPRWLLDLLETGDT